MKMILPLILLLLPTLTAAQVCSPPPTLQCLPPNPQLTLVLPGEPEHLRRQRSLEPQVLRAKNDGDCSICDGCGQGCSDPPPGGGGPGGAPGGGGAGGGGAGGGGAGGGGIHQQKLLATLNPDGVREVWLERPAGGQQSGLLSFQLTLDGAHQLAEGARVRVLGVDFADAQAQVTAVQLELARSAAAPSGWIAHVYSDASPHPLPLLLPAQDPDRLALPVAWSWRRSGAESLLQVDLAGATVQLALPAGSEPVALQTGVLAANGIARRQPQWQLLTGIERFERDGVPARH